MDAKQMDEILARILVKAARDIFLEAVAPLVSAGIEINEDELKATTDAMLQRMQNAMHWLPMSDDAVFEDGTWCLVALRDFPDDYLAVKWTRALLFSTGMLRFDRTEITHYARITEPK